MHNMLFLYLFTYPPLAITPYLKTIAEEEMIANKTNSASSLSAIVHLKEYEGFCEAPHQWLRKRRTS